MPKALSKKELANAYGIHPSTLRRWLNSIPKLHLEPNQRLLNPAQLRIIFDHLGEPK